MDSVEDESPPPILGSSGDSSPASVESSFRELDDVFLQTQTGIWLGEVLNTRLNEKLSISDLLADGELLFEVSRALREMLLRSRVESRYGKAYKDVPFASRKTSGRYTPYSNVDSFLKVCKIFGLTGIDLFSPSDVVEKRNTRKVCMCIRYLSMKTRAMHLKVPDFDIVTYSVSMPTEMVECIRKSWEQSRCSVSHSSSDYSTTDQDSRKKSLQKNSLEASGGNCLYSETSNDTESNLKSLCVDYPYSVDSPEVSSTIVEYDCNQDKDAYYNTPQNKACYNGGKLLWFDGGSSTSDAYRYTSSFGSNTIASTSENQHRTKLDDEDDDDDVEVLSITSMSSVSGPLLDTDSDGELYIEEDFKDAQFCVAQNQMSNPEEHLSITVEKDNFSRKKPLVPSTQPYMSSYEDHSVSISSDIIKVSELDSDALKIIDCEGKYDEAMSSNGGKGPVASANFLLVEGLHDTKSVSNVDREAFGEMTVEPGSRTKRQTDSYVNSINVHDNINTILVETDASPSTAAGGGSKEDFIVDNISAEDDSHLHHQDSIAQSQGGTIGNTTTGDHPSVNQCTETTRADNGEPTVDGQHCSMDSCLENTVRESLNQELRYYEADGIDNGDKSYEKMEDALTAENNIKKEEKHTEISNHKPPKRKLLKSVIKSTAVVGLLVMLLRYRKSDREHTRERITHTNPIKNTDGGRFLMQKGGKKDTKNGVYPAEKLV